MLCSRRLFFIFTLAFFLPLEAFAKLPFPDWLEQTKREAIENGISEETVYGALNGLKPIDRVIELDRKQPEGKMSFVQYEKRVITPARIRQGRELLEEHRAELEQISRKYGVPPQYIVALWGIETSYGKNTGGFSVIAALATLAYEGRRAEFFKAELINALRILDEGHIGIHQMKGSWAGAMGQNQFMPSSFHNFAVDENKDGRRDIWTTLPDIFASTANYLSKSGWKPGFRWGRPVKLSATITESMTGLNQKKSLQKWKALGVTTKNGRVLPVEPGMQASLVAPDGLSGPAFLVYDNYGVIMRWNKSTYFATSVGLLADAIAN